MKSTPHSYVRYWISTTVIPIKSNKAIKATNKLGLFAAGAICYAMGSCVFSAKTYHYTTDNRHYIHYQGKDYRIHTPEMDLLHNRITSILDEPPGKVRTTIENLLKEKH